MSLYRADPQDGVAWITGASSGIGRRVALDLAGLGYTVAATARGEAKLEELVREARGLRGRIMVFPCDVTDEAGMARTIGRIEAEAGKIVLAIFNAGTFNATQGERLETEGFVRLFTTNVFGTIFGLVPVANLMRDRGFGHIAVVGSVTAYFGLPAAAAYGSTKAALNSIATSLRYDFERLNIRIQIINPGWVETPLTARNKFPMPTIIKVEEASRRIVEGLREGGFEITFPRRLSWTLKAGLYLPAALWYRIVRKATGWDRRVNTRQSSK